MTPEAAALSATIKRANPHRVVVLDAQGEEHPIAVPTKGHKWERVAETICGLPWDSILMFDDADPPALVGPPIKMQLPAAPEPTLDDQHPIPDTPEGQNLRLVLRGQAEALAHHRAIVDPVLQANAAALTSIVQAFNDLLGNFARALQLAAGGAEAIGQAKATAASASGNGADSLTADKVMLELLRAAGPKIAERFLGKAPAELPPGSPS